MRALLALVLVAGCATTTVFDPAGDRAYYEETVARLLRQPGRPPLRPDQVDFARLRRGSACATAVAAALAQANARDDRATALRTAEALLAHDFTDVAAHLTKARELHDAERGAEAGFHEALALGLMQARDAAD